LRHPGGRPEAQERRSHGAGEGAAPTQVKGRGRRRRWERRGEGRKRVERRRRESDRGTEETSDAVGWRETERDGAIFIYSHSSADAWDCTVEERWGKPEPLDANQTAAINSASVATLRSG